MFNIVPDAKCVLRFKIIARVINDIVNEFTLI
jgi:hypothetical protein